MPASRTPSTAGPARFVALLLWFSLAFTMRLLGASTGTVVPIRGEPGALAYDSAHRLLFISNTTQNRVEVYSLDKSQLLTPIAVGHAPVGLAVVPESGALLVANSQESFLTLIDLTTLSVAGTIPIPPRTPTSSAENPFSVAALAGGSALASTNFGLLTVDVGGKTTTTLLSPLFNIPPNSDLVSSGDGRVVFGQGAGTAFLYNPSSSALFEQFRTVTSSRLLAADQSGTHFMLGDSALDRQFSQASRINPLTAPGTSLGGVALRPDGSRVYAGYNLTSTGKIAVLQGDDLRQLSSFVVPEAITGRMMVTPDGSRLFAISTSGVTVVDLLSLPALPSLQVSNRVLNFSFQACNLAAATQTIEITNSGGGVFGWTATSGLPAVTLNSSSGNGPATLQIRVDPSGFAFRGTVALSNVIKIVSDESISGDQTITLLVNVTNPDQVGSIYPVDGYLSDILVDDLRQRVLLVNSTRNEIDVFSISQHVFLKPIPVGAVPKSIAFSIDRKQLLVTNLGTEYVTKIDADLLSPTALIRIPAPLPPVPPRSSSQSAGTHPFSIAQSSNGATLLVATTQDATPQGTVYRVDPNSSNAVAVPGLGTAPNAVSGFTYIAATGDRAFLLLAENGGNLHLYDSGTGNFALNPSLGSSIGGNVAASADGSFYHTSTSVLNRALTPQADIPSGITGVPITVGGFAFAPAGTMAYRGIRPTTISATSPAPRIEKVDAATQKVVSAFNVAEALTPSANSLSLAISRQLAVDNSETTLYGISDSGLIVIPLPGSGSSAGPQISSGGIVNGASFAPAPSPVAPGSIAAIFGSNLAQGIKQPEGFPLPFVLGGTCVTFDGLPAPLFYVSADQLNVQVPWGLAGKSTAQVAVGSGALSAQPVLVNLASQAPGIFTFSGGGQGTGAVLHSSDFSPVSSANPATIGEIISIYANGLGPTSPAIETGVPAPSDGTLYRTAQVAVTIGGASGTVMFSGLAPGFVGLYQIDVRVPSNAPLGTRVPIVVSSGTQASQQVTIAVNPAR